ncbi:MAG: CRTAC1 family protein [Thalassotalea sp.]
MHIFNRNKHDKPWLKNISVLAGISFLSACVQLPYTSGTSATETSNSTQQREFLVNNNAAAAFTAVDKASIDDSFFVAALKDISLEQANRRKWDTPVIADLDQDGFLDLLLTDHGYSIKVYWNNKGKFGKGIDIHMGDNHGITVGDFDNDGRQDIFVARGGGSGDNARNTKLFHVVGRNIIGGEEFSVPFLNMRGRTVKLVDGDNDGDLDLLMFGFPPGGKSKQNPSYFYENTGNGQMVLASELMKTQRDGQKMLLTDFNNDHIPDFLLYGDGKVTAHQGNGDFTFKDVTKDFFASPLLHVTNIVEIDIDNDGDQDLYFTRGKELIAGETFFDQNTNTFAFYTKRGKFQFADLLVGDILALKNYQSSWPHQAIYLGESGYEYEHTSEYHSGQDVKLVSSNALGFPDKLDKKGIYIGYIGNGQWRIAGDTWSPTSGVVLNVADYAAYSHERGVKDILLENVNGKYVDKTDAANLSLVAHTEAVTAGDFDNNGFKDLFVVQRGNLATTNKQLLLLNQGNGQFKTVEQHQVISQELGATGIAAETFDYNKDGKLDLIYANERGGWHLFKNTLAASKDNNFIKINVGSSPAKQVSALGAVVTVQACQQTYKTRVGSSAAKYSQSFDNQIHVGLGSCKTIKQVNVRWSSGESSTNNNVGINKITKIGQHLKD